MENKKPLDLKKIWDFSLVKETLINFFTKFFANLWKLVGVNLVWFVFAAPVFALIFLKSRVPLLLFFVLFFIFLMFSAPFTASVFSITLELFENKNDGIKTGFFSRAKKYFKKSIAGSLILAAFFTFGLFLSNFFLPKPIAGNILFSSVGLIIILITALMQNYFFAILVKYDADFKSIFLNAVYLTFDNFIFNVIIFAIFAVMIIIFCFSFIGVVILFMSAPALLYNLALKILMEKKYKGLKTVKSNSI